jgi:hypothetical protein
MKIFLHYSLISSWLSLVYSLGTFRLHQSLCRQRQLEKREDKVVVSSFALLALGHKVLVIIVDVGLG